MADVFISYKKEDIARVRMLGAALEQQGFSVWWDYAIEVGSDWWDSILREIETARCTVGIWSDLSVGSNAAFTSNYVAEEHARAGEKLLPALFAPDRIPVQYRNREAAILHDWDGSQDHAEWKALLAKIESVATPLWVTRRYAELRSRLTVEVFKRKAAEDYSNELEARLQELAGDVAGFRNKGEIAMPAEPDATGTGIKLPVPPKDGVQLDLKSSSAAVVSRWRANPDDLIQMKQPLVDLTHVTGEVTTFVAPATGYLEIFAFDGAQLAKDEVFARLTKPD